MPTLWFILVAFMIAMYAILDGFDLGAGIIHLMIARNDGERRLVLRAIGPVWDGNEVWLIAAGGTLYLAFPLVYASSFSGFYLPLMIVLWLLMLRGLGIELRHQIHHPLWKSFWDVVFSFSSILLSVFLGAALGNVVRGVPLNEQGYFFEPLWTSFAVGPDPGILDWFTMTLGLAAISTLTVHGANYISMKTDGEIQQRARSAAAKAWWGIVLTSAVALIATLSIRPQMWTNFSVHPWAFLFPVGGVAGLIGSNYFRHKGKDAAAFLSSGTFIASMLASTAVGLFPNLLPASVDLQRSLTIYNSATSAYGLGVGIVWWVVGMLLASVYFVYVYRSFRGKVTAGEEGQY